MNRVNPAFLTEPAIASPGSSRLLAGLLLSFALHGALLLAWHQGKPAQAPAPAARTTIAVWLRPPPPTPPAPPQAEPARPSAAAAKPASAARPKRRVAAAVIALPQQAPAVPPRPDAFTVEPPEPASAAPHFDVDAARKTARRLANEPDPAKAGTALAQFPAKPLETETKAARAISQAKRRDCKDGIPGGLLAPLYLMMDKKDSGCKW